MLKIIHEYLPPIEKPQTSGATDCTGTTTLITWRTLVRSRQKILTRIKGSPRQACGKGQPPEGLIHGEVAYQSLFHNRGCLATLQPAMFRLQYQSQSKGFFPILDGCRLHARGSGEEVMISSRGANPKGRNIMERNSAAPRYWKLFSHSTR
jgi:hypothetical protein